MGKARILIVEDEALVAESLREDLEGLGYAVVGVIDSGERVVETVAETKPDLILMDIHLAGGVDGIDAAFQAKVEFDVPVIYLTAYADDKTLSRASTTTPAAYLMKPINERELIANISMALAARGSKESVVDRLRGNEPLVDVLESPAIVLDSEGLIRYANRAALAFLHANDLSLLRGESISRFVDFGSRDSTEQACLVLSTDGASKSAYVRMDPLNLSNGDQIGALVLFEEMSGKERRFLETSARALNEALLARLPSPQAAGDGYTLRGFLLPCTSGSGDFFDLFPLGDSHFCFYTLDVMGHGPLAALVAWALRDTLRDAARELSSPRPSEVLSLVNDRYRANSFVPESIFVSLVMGIVERETGEYRVARAGHPPCLHLWADGRTDVLLTPGTALGISPFLETSDARGVLGPSDRLVLYSDGLVETLAGPGGRLEDAIGYLSSRSRLPIDEFVQDLNQEARNRFSGDDTSLLVVEREGHPQGPMD